MKKIICLLLMAVLSFSMVSCSGTQEEVFDRPLDEAYEKDLTGLTFRWGSAWPQQLIPESGYSSAGDKTLQRIKDLKEKYGCDFTVEQVDDGSSKVMQALAAGLPTIDILDSHAETGGIQCYKANLLYCLEDISTINIDDEKWGTKAFSSVRQIRPEAVRLLSVCMGISAGIGRRDDIQQRASRN